MEIRNLFKGDDFSKVNEWYHAVSRISIRVLKL